MSRETKLVKNTLVLSIGTLLPKVAAFLTLPILTGCLTKEQYGTYDLVTILVSLLLPITTMQIHTAGFRFLIENKNDRNLAGLYLSNILAFVIPVSVITLIITYFFLPTDSFETRFWICVYLFFDTIVAEFRQITRGMGESLKYSISAIISACVKLILAFLLVKLMKYELMGAIIALALSPVLSLLYLFFKIRAYELINFKFVSKRVMKEMLSYSWPMVPNNMSSWVMRVSDRFVVTGFMGLEANAVYSVANKIPSLLMLAQNTFSMAWQENASIVSKDEDSGKYYSQMFSVMLGFYAGCLGLIIVSTPLLFKILIKGDYNEAYEQMPVLFLAMFFHCMSAFLGGIYIALKETKSVGITTVIAAVCNLAIDIMLINVIGLFAASGSTLVSYLLLFLYRLYDLRKHIDIKYDYKKIILVSAFLLVETVLYYFDSLPFYILNAIIAIFTFVVLNRALLESVFRKVFKKAT